MILVLGGDSADKMVEEQAVPNSLQERDIATQL